MLLGHYDHKTKRKQSLLTHLFNVAGSASESATLIKQSNTGYLLGLLHDLGKADRNFQIKLKEQPKKRVNHSSAGAKFFSEYLIQRVLSYIPKEQHSLFAEFMEVIIYIITAHHGIYDIWQLGTDENIMQRRIMYDEDNTYFYKEDILEFAGQVESELEKRKNINFGTLIRESFHEFLALDSKLKPSNREEQSFYTGLKVRLLLSILKNADIEDTMNAYEKIVEPFTTENLVAKKENYLEEVERVYKKFGDPTNEINSIRNRLSEEALKRGEKDGPGVYQLNLPTGAGKTLISLRYGMHQLNKKSKARFIYITPFLSVLEQNAKEIKNILNDSDIVEHHSNIVQHPKSENEENNDNDLGEQKATFNKYLTDTWDSPIILSTMVQFFQTLFKGKSSNIRRFSSLRNAVIVLDEVQSLPVTVTHIFNLTMNFIAQTMESVIIMCTATQPTYDSKYIKYKLNYGGKNDEPKSIVNLTEEERKLFDRTEVHKLTDGVVAQEELFEEVQTHPGESTLIVLNTKNAVRILYEELSDRTDRQVYYLTTNLCPKHRQNIVDEMKERLSRNESIVCVSTQLIEAGVDIDFNRLIRSYAGIDSIIQAMGRCNRHGKNKEKGNVKLARVSRDFEKIEKIEEINEKAKVTSYILDNKSSPIDIVELNSDFYNRYYANNWDKMNFPLSKKDGPSAFEYLSTNKALYNSQMKKKSWFKVLNQSFQTAGKHIDLIRNDTVGVIVYYQESKLMIERLINLIEEFETDYKSELLPYIKSCMNELQPYTVNMYMDYETRGHVISYLDGNINILVEGFYDEEMGIVDEVEDLLF